jgi:succinate dehydrogenase/fumarate reductase-like Fe-S protein
VAEKTVRFIIKRQDTPEAKPYWEEFDLRVDRGGHPGRTVGRAR